MPKSKKKWTGMLKRSVRKLLGGKKKYTPVKGLGKPRTLAEGLAVERRLAAKRQARAATSKKTATSSSKKTGRTRDIEKSGSSQMGKGESLQAELKKLRNRGKK